MSSDFAGSAYFEGSATQFLTTSGGAGGSSGGGRSGSPASRPTFFLPVGSEPGGGGLETATFAGPTATRSTRNEPSGWIAPDFGFWTASGRLALIDWKTGGADPDSAAFQLGCYALYAREMLGVEPANVDLLEVNLREPTVTKHHWDAARLEEIRERLRLSIRSMKAYLADPAGNVAVVEGFERTEELRLCRWCNFRIVCRPEL